MTNDRTDTARAHDDKSIIDRASDAPDQGGSSGGNLQRDVATRREADRIDDPDGHERVTKQDDIDNNDAYRSTRPRG
jgi:hypothetical protein